jgi:hypothetical protein
MLLMLGDKSTKSVTKKGVSQQKSVLLLCLYAYLRTWILANQQNHKKMERNIRHCLKKKETGTSSLLQCLHAYLHTCSKKSQPKG